MNASAQEFAARDHGCLIDGQWRGANSGARFSVSDPGNGQLLAQLPDMGAAETRQAIDAASTALPDWSARTAKQRADSSTKIAAQNSS